MKKKKNVTISINNKLFELIDQNFDNKSKIIEYILIKLLSRNDKLKDIIKNIEL